MYEGAKIDLQDSQGKEIKIGDLLIVKSWSLLFGEILENVLVRVIWEKFAVQLQKVDDESTKFLSVYCDHPETLTLVEEENVH